MEAGVGMRTGSLRMSSSSSFRSGSLRMHSSSIWRADDDVFSRSVREEDDEEALKWATLEKLPTYDRVRRGLLNIGETEQKEIDIRGLGSQEKQILLDRLVRVAEEDNEKFLLKLRERIDRVGLDFPTIEVRFEHLDINGKVFVGSRGLPTFTNTVINALETLGNSLHMLSSKKKSFSILHDISGIVKPHRITLLLGPPGSGKTTLLLALAGKLGSDLKVKVSGSVTYNGHQMHEFVPQRAAAYISQHDLHIAEMTVRETLAFSARCQGTGPRYDMLLELMRREKAANIKPDPDIDVFMKAISVGGQETNALTDYTLKILGLDICADTLVGSDMLRGISGGQKKRVTTGEMLVGTAKALFMDEISTGLDSSTTFQIVNSLRQSIHILGGTAIIALLQPAPETYDLFDDIILISDGQIIYQGPREHVLEFFESMGFKCPERKGVADFLQEVTSRKDQQQYWRRHDEPYKFVPSKDFAVAFHSFHVGQKLREELSIPFDKSKSHPAALTKTKYGANKMDMFKACAAREFLLMKRNSFVYVFRALQLMTMACITMTLFMRTHMHHNTVNDGGVYMGALFFSTMTVMFNGFAELSLILVKLPVIFKQRDYLFYPAWAYSIPNWILKIPIAFVEIGIWVFMSYYVIGFDPSAARLFKQYLLLVLLSQMGSGMFRLVAVVSRQLVIANTVSSFTLLVVIVFGGFILSHDNIKGWWIWAYWISPLMYGQNAMVINEFLGKSWSHIVPGTNQPLGVIVLKARGAFTKAYWYWIGVVVMIGYTLLFNYLIYLGLAYLKPIGSAQPTVPEDHLEERHDNVAAHATTQSNPESSRIDIEVADTDQSRRGMVLPFTPLSITFDTIRYSVDIPPEMKAKGIEGDKLELLKGVSGSFRPGVLTALMGVSGAGKTTLMDVLAGRKTGGYIVGNVTVSGYPKNQKTFARISGYCEQNDIHSPRVTVYESLLYSAWLRLPSEVNFKKRKMFVEEVMELVELTAQSGALVGLPGVSGLSTEQRKRLTIAVELVANPSIIFMDEPTSGLDARAAAIVMRAVRNTVDTGRTVVCTIHQPSIDIFEAFDELFLMRRGGEEIYVGPLGHHSCHLISYFESIEGVSKIKDSYNPATWMLEVSAISQEQILGVNFVDVYKNSELYQRNKALIKELSTPPPGSKDLHFPTQYSQPFGTQCMACLWKQYLSYWRNPPYTALRFFFTLMIALLFGTIFWGLGSKRTKQQDLFNAMGSMYSAVVFMGVSYSSSVQPVVAIEKTVFYRERAAGMYSAIPYAISQVTIELPYVLVQSLMYSVIVYSTIGFEWTATKFLWYALFSYMTLLYYTFYGMMAVGLTPNFSIGAIVSSAFYGLWSLFSGFVMPRTRMPVYWRWYYWMNPVAWSLYGMLTSQFGDVQDRLESGETVAEFLRDYFGYRREFLGVVAVVVACYGILFAFCFAMGIKLLNFNRR